MSGKLKLGKITLVSKGGASIELTIDEARDLHAQLAELFAPKLVPQAPIFIDRYAPFWGQYRPVWATEKVTPSLNPYEVTCQSASGFRTMFSCEEVNDGNVG